MNTYRFLEKDWRIDVHPQELRKGTKKVHVITKEKQSLPLLMWLCLLCDVIILALWHDHTCCVRWSCLLWDMFDMTILAMWHDDTCCVTSYSLCDIIMQCETWSCLLCDVILAVWHNYAMWDMIMLAARNVHASCRTVALRKKFCWQTWEL